MEASSKAYGMEQVLKWLKDKKVTPIYDLKTGQNYAEYVDPQENATYKVWQEDEISVKKRAQLVHRYNLAGTASWRRGFEDPQVWPVLKNSLQRIYATE